MAALDTNVLVYAEGLSFSLEDDRKVGISRALLHDIAVSGELAFIPAQALVELHHVLVRRARCSRAEAERRIARLADNSTIIATTAEVLKAAYQLSARHNIPTFDSIILAAAAEAGCDLLYSEDFQAGFVWHGVKVVNTFA